jgi:uncharacterized protein YwgA
MEKNLNSECSKSEIILNVLGLVPTEQFSPVQIQKLFFLLDKKLGFGCFNFQAHLYGPYDKGLTDALKRMSVSGKSIDMKNIDGLLYYQINSNSIPDTSRFLDRGKREFIINMVSFVKSLSFKQLCMAIYNEFPDMAKNSVFFGK